MLLPNSLHSCHQKCGHRSALHFPGDVFAAPERAGGSPAQGPMPYLDDDIPLLNVEEEPGESWLRPALLTMAGPGCLCQGMRPWQDVFSTGWS